MGSGRSARRYETEFARLRWEDEQKRATIVCLVKKNEHLESQITNLEKVVDEHGAQVLQARNEMQSRSVKMCGSLFAGHEKSLLKNCFGAWREYALHEVAREKLLEDNRRKDRELREKVDRLKAQRIKITSLEEEMGRLSAALQAEKEKYSTAKDHQAFLNAEAMRKQEQEARDRAQELINLEKNAMSAATQLGIRIPRSMLTQEEYLQKGGKATYG